ncbi:hypothetical protein FUT48_00200 [Pseudomonas sp. JG-B]|nr:hypothetical protein [Pseudomonas sp. JG-B]
MLYVIAIKLIPRMAILSDPEYWTGAAYLLYLLSYFVEHYGVASIAVILLVLIAVVRSLPRLVRGRRVLDKFPIYSTYRALNGATFLLNVAVMMRANIPLYEALRTLSNRAQPWLEDRIEAALRGVGLGKNLGVALDLAGHNFPDKKAIRVITVLSGREGFEEAINRYAERWLNAVIKKIQKTASVMFIICILFIGALVGLVAIGTTQMNSDFSNSIESRAN